MSSGRRSWCLPLSIAAIILIIIAIIVPLAVILPRKGHNGHKSTVILPLYIYPDNSSSWSPLYDALEANPDLKFTVIVNPSSGPGSSTYPDDDYSAALLTLSTYSTVQTVGYVRTGYATRNISTILSEISRYAGWATKSSAFAMQGIFFDEAPHEYSSTAVDYMRTINEAVKNATGLQGERTVIHNPGTIPDTRYNDTKTDITVVFEDTYEAYQSKVASLSALPKHRSNYSYMINSVPSGMSVSSLRKFVDRLSRHAKYLLITDNEEGYYESFGSDWANFTSVVPR